MAGKTLGTDVGRGKCTLADDSPGAQDRVRQQITSLCRSALDCLRAWPGARRGLADFYALDLQPVFARYGNGLNECLSEVR